MDSLLQSISKKLEGSTTNLISLGFALRILGIFKGSFLILRRRHITPHSDVMTYLVFLF